jgi:hypothetical protein
MSVYVILIPLALLINILFAGISIEHTLKASRSYLWCASIAAASLGLDMYTLRPTSQTRVDVYYCNYDRRAGDSAGWYFT